MPLLPVNETKAETDIKAEAIDEKKRAIAMQTLQSSLTSSKPSPLDGLMAMSNDIFKVLDAFGVKKEDVGKALLKSFLTGKLNLIGLGANVDRPTKFEKALRAIRDLLIPFMIFYICLKLLTIMAFVKWGIII